MTNHQTHSRRRWLAGAAILATATLIMDAGAAYAESKVFKLPYTTKADLKSKCDAAKGEFDDIVSDYVCSSKGGAVACNSETKTCTGVTSSASANHHSRLPLRVQEMPQLSPADD